MDKTTLTSRTSSAYSLLKATPQDIADVLLAWRQFRLQVSSDARLSQSAIQGDLSAARDKAIEQVNTAVLKAQDWKEQIERTVAEALSGPQDTNEKLLEQIGRQRMWDRLKPLLLGGRDPLSLIAEAGASGDALALRTLREELPAYLGMPSGAASVRTGYEGQEVAALLAAIDQAEMPLLSPLEQQARSLGADVARGFANGVLAAQNYVLYEVQGRGTASFVPAWADKDLIDLPDTTTANIRL